MDLNELQALCYENEYNNGKYHMFWLDKDDVSHEEEYETLEEMISDYNDFWVDGSWDFVWLNKEGHEFYPWGKK